MRPTHVVLVGECVQKWSAAVSLPHLDACIKQHAPLPLAALVRNAFRDAPSAEVPAHIDAAFSALRALSSMEAWVQDNNKLYDSLSGISDREAPEEPSMRFIASRILHEAR